MHCPSASSFYRYFVASDIVSICVCNKRDIASAVKEVAATKSAGSASILYKFIYT